MSHIFRFHKGRNNNIDNWRASDRISAEDVKDVLDKSVTVTSSAGTSIPTPLARLFLFKTAFEIVAAQTRNGTLSKDSIYAGLVSETLDMLELLYKCGSDSTRFRYQKWVFETNESVAQFFGNHTGHVLLSKSFEQAADQAPFNKRIELTLVFYKENNKEVLLGGTSPFTFVFTSPNFKRKFKERGFKAINGLTSNSVLFSSAYQQLHERDKSFIKYIQALADKTGANPFFNGFREYVTYTVKHYEAKFDGTLSALQDIRIGDTTLISAEITLQQITTESHQVTIHENSDYKIQLPDDSPYKLSKHGLTPLFLLDRMEYQGQYSSASNLWSSQTRVLEISYPETTVEEILERELPDLHIKYPFVSSFDFFESTLVKLPGYVLNDKRFVTINGSQSYLFPIKPLFFHFFPVDQLNNYLRIESVGKQVTFILDIPVYGPSKKHRNVICSKTYELESAVQYSGILGIFPFTKATQKELLHINNYTVASFEKTNADTAISNIKFFKRNGTDAVISSPVLRSNNSDVNTKTTYYQVKESFEMIQLNFRKNNISCGGVIIPKFKQVENGDASYIYAIDFGTSNTHVEYGIVKIDGDRKQVARSMPFEITEEGMQMYLLNKPREVVLNDGADYYNDYERSMGNTIDSARQLTIREFVPFQIGPQKSASVQFPFRTATCENSSFIASSANNRLFIDANIGFFIDEDVMFDHIRYKTDLKWMLQSASTDQLNINRVSLFAKELLLLIRTKVLLEKNDVKGDLNKVKLILSFPVSMGETLKNKLTEIFDEQRKEVFGADAMPLAQPVTESIAPYYQLKSEDINIQNDNFCNIDIGGGTTDIVLTKTEHTSGAHVNELQCFCSSFKFAGRQLWSSGGNEYQLNDNGFLAYYKDFIRRTDPGVSDKLDKILNNNTVKTEDVVGLLFSKPEYRFKDVFTANPELKVVPLIHYAAILYYISRVAGWKDIKLPRTIGFSGKGSEYLNLLFPLSAGNQDADLKGFTQRLLGVFSKQETRADFKVKRTDQPKVITAKGALHYAVEDIKDNAGDDWGNNVSSISVANEKKLVKSNVLFMGFKDLELENPSLTYGDFASRPELYQDIMDSQMEFFNLLFDNPELNAQLNKKLELRDFSKYKQFFVPRDGSVFEQGKLRDSFKATLANYDPSEKVTDSPFFFPLNYALTELSKEISNLSLNQS